MKKNYKFPVVLVALVASSFLTTTKLNAQNIGINATGAAPLAPAGLDIDFTNKGLLIPRVALTATNAAGPIALPTTSLLVYNTATAGAGATAVTPGYYYNGGTPAAPNWTRFSTGGDDWKIIGNGNITGGTHFLGTTNNVQLDFRTNNAVRFSVKSNGDQVFAGGTGGTAALPFYSWAADPDVGMYSIAANTFGFATNAVERFRMSATEAVFNDASNNYDFRVESDSRTNMFFIDGGNNRIGINTGAPQGQFEYVHDGAAVGGFSSYWTNTTTDGAMQLMNSTTTGNGSRVFLSATNYNASAFVASAVMGLSLNGTTTGSGGVGVLGAANNESGNAVEGSLSFSGGYSGWAGYFNADVFSGGAYLGSDRRLKRDIKPITGALEMIEKIEPVSYYMDTEKYPGIGYDENRLSYGFIAQDLELIIPEMVKEKNLVLNSNIPKSADEKFERKTELFKVVNYTLMIPIAVEAIKEQQEIIKSQEERIKALEIKLEQLLKDK
ncbi:MAG: tail fiber domain-containing protein [Flavobacteriales bacterium]|nr:tail fiber domain-containing protein [Flavobacteriales bacterium]MCB9174813.1 tail fiber domain-containing protein [Flavobacteriales bacterium]